MKGVSAPALASGSQGHSSWLGPLGARIRSLLPLVLVGLGWVLPSHAEPRSYDPDRGTCQTEVIRRAYQANLLPWEDQPEMVRQRLRQLQAAMTLDTLRECQRRGFLTADQVASLEAELELRTPAGPAVPPGPSQSPTRP